MPKSNAPVVSRGPAKQKPPATVSNLTVRPRARRASTLTLPPHLALHADPFTATVEGAGRPDFNSLPVVVWRESQHLTLSSNADGNLWFTVRPCVYTNLQNNVLTAATTTIASIGYSSYANYSELAAMFSLYRPLTLCVEAEYVGEAQLAKGILAINRHQGSPIVADNSETYADEPSYKEGPAGQDRVAGAAHYSENDFAAINAVFNDQGFSVFGFGLPASTACVRLSYSIVFEATVGANKLLSRGVTHTIAHPPQIAVAASIVGNKSATAVGPDPVDTLVKHTKQLINTASKVNGLIKSARPVVADLAEFASLLLL